MYNEYFEQFFDRTRPTDPTHFRSHPQTMWGVEEGECEEHNREEDRMESRRAATDLEASQVTNVDE